MASNEGSSAESNQNMQWTSPGLTLSQVIPALEEVRKGKVNVVPTPAIPSMTKRKEEVVVERVMENCAFKTVMACVLGKYDANVGLPTSKQVDNELCVASSHILGWGMPE